jgi:hypothetical protein
MGLYAPALIGFASQLVLDRMKNPPVSAIDCARLLTQTNRRPALLVRRSSDGTTDAINYKNGLLDTVSLLGFCGSGNGFVQTAYSQISAAGDFTQTDNSGFQPQIVSSGSLITANGKPAIQFYNATQPIFFDVPSLVNPIGTQASYLNTVAQWTSADTNQRLMTTGSSQWRAISFGSGSIALFAPPQQQISVSYPAPNAVVIITAAFATGSPSGSLFVNGTQIATSTGALGGDSATYLRYGQGLSSGYWQSMAQSAMYGLGALTPYDRAILELDQARFYGISGVTA